MNQISPSAMMVAGASMLETNGYSVRVWMALKAINEARSAPGIPTVLLSFESLRSMRNKERFQSARRKAASLQVELICVPLLPKKVPQSFAVNSRYAASRIRSCARSSDTTVVHAQSHFAAGAAALALRKLSSVQLVFDLHGVDVEERLDDGRLISNSSEFRSRRHYERLAIDRANWVLPVSGALATQLQVPKEKIRVVPCISSLPSLRCRATDLRAQARSKLSIADDPVVLYLGGASAWQQPEYLVSCFAELHKRRPDVIFLIVTGEVETFQSLFAKNAVPLENVRIVSVPHYQVPEIAAAADVGMLLRENTIVNRVASPTKFAEYLAMGVPVLLTDTLEDFAKITSQRNLGRVVSADLDAEAVSLEVDRLLHTVMCERDDISDRCEQAYKEVLSFQSILPVYREIYGR